MWRDVGLHRDIGAAMKNHMEKNWKMTRQLEIT